MKVDVTEAGFTIAEMIVTIVVMTVFAGLLFQVYLTSVTQQSAVTLRSTADDIAVSNLKKIAARSSPLVSSVTCGPTNDLTATPAGTGTAISSVPYGSTPGVGAFAEESYGGLPTPRSQTLVVLFPRGCSDPTLPVQIVSTVTYGSQSVAHSSYVN